MRRFKFFTLHLTLSCLFISCGDGKETGTQEQSSSPKELNTEDFRALAGQHFETLDLSSLPDKNGPKVVLGKALFFDPRLSETGEVSCNSCHDINKFGVDNKALSEGVNGHMTERNSPTILNTSGQVAQFWDGRATTLREQVRMPIMNESEMGMTEETLISILKSDEQYQQQFGLAFPNEEIDMDNMADALASYIESEVYYSKFDLYQLGETELSASELAGMKIFIDKGCTDCHDGVLLGGNDFEKFGVFDDYWKLTKSTSQDSGRFLVTGDPEDLYVFKTPSLRNVSMTQPYFHDGSVESLQEAVRIMGKVQLDIDLSNEEVRAIVGFLSTLTGENSSI